MEIDVPQLSDNIPLNSKIVLNTKVEDILNFKNNWNVYQKLLEECFIPFIGAGLSAGIGVGGWDTLIEAIGDRVFYTNCFSHIKGEDEKKIKLCKKDKMIFNTCYSKLENLDKLDIEEADAIQEHVKQRIEILEEFGRRCIEEGKKKADLQIKMFLRLVKNKRLFSSYEAAELLRIVCDSEESLYDILRQEVNRSQPKGGKWIVGEEKAVYWLPHIIKKVNLEGKDIHFDCYTTNFDTIIEDVCASVFPEIKVGHLHGEIGGDKKYICLTLSDLYRIYGDRLNIHAAKTMFDDNSVVAKMEMDNHGLTRYLFIGTSFSEQHIGTLARLKMHHNNNYAIIAIDSIERNKMEEIHLKVKAFGVKSDNILFYSIRNNDHSELVTLLHQLTRDLDRSYWNQWQIIDYLFKMNGGLDQKQNIYSASISALKWLKKGNDYLDVLHVKSGEQDFFDEESGYLIYNDSDAISSFFEMLKKEFSRPNWSVCVLPYFLADLRTKDFDKNNMPLGDTLYIIIESEDDEHIGGFMDALNQWLTILYHIDVHCKIVHITIRNTKELEKHIREGDSENKKDSVLTILETIERDFQGAKVEILRHFETIMIIIRDVNKNTIESNALYCLKKVETTNLYNNSNKDEVTLKRRKD